MGHHIAARHPLPDGVGELLCPIERDLADCLLDGGLGRRKAERGGGGGGRGGSITPNSAVGEESYFSSLGLGPLDGRVPTMLHCHHGSMVQSNRAQGFKKAGQRAPSE